MKKRTALLLLLALCLAVTAAWAETVNINGTWTGDTYENPALGFGCRLEGWEPWPAELLAELVAQSAENEEVELQTLNGMVMEAVSADGLHNVAVLVQDMNDYAAEYREITPEEQVESLLEDIESTFDGMDVTNVRAETGSAVLGGQPCPCLVVQYEFAGVQFYARQAVMQKDHYWITVNVTCSEDDKTDEILRMFYLTD